MPPSCWVYCGTACLCCPVWPRGLLAVPLPKPLSCLQDLSVSDAAKVGIPCCRFHNLKEGKRAGVSNSKQTFLNWQIVEERDVKLAGNPIYADCVKTGFCGRRKF